MHPPPAGALSANPSSSGDSAGARLNADCVYLLMFPGWERELRSNRWHYASRWAKRRPVVLVQPSEQISDARSIAEPRIANCRVLHVSATADAAGYFSDVQRQAAQVSGDMRAHGHSRPLLWLYNPQLAGAFADLPAVCRVFHATENYFNFAGATEFFLRQTRAALRISDLVLAVSEGVAASIAREVPAASIRTVTNGCDYAFYAAGTADGALSRAREAFERLAVYAGNINWRLDFRLLARCAAALPRTLFAFYGPVVGLRGDDRRDWGALCLRPNVRHHPPVEAERLPGIYAVADVGIVPYKHDPWIVQSGFPLKVLEMGAAGLPVVTTMMKPIESLAAAVTVCRDADQFLGAAAQRSRQGLSPAERDEMRAICARNDYDRKFEEVAALVERITGAASGASVRGAELRAVLPAAKGTRARLQAWLRRVARLVPGSLRGALRPRTRRALKNWLER